MERRAIAIQGTVQGVGFRPFVHGLASRLHLGGFVRNQTSGVQIEVEGEPDPLDQFLSNLVTSAAPLAHIDSLSWQPLAPCGDRRFRIEASDATAAGPIVFAPDTATCDDCLRELLDPGDRRFRYPFLNCTNCGPRLTIVTAAPYDRERTTMAAFPMCPPCRAEYDDPADRRFHAQPTACPICGPQLQLLDAAGHPVACDDPLAAFAAALADGKIGALKGLGGYHLACDATNHSAVAALRQRKQREEKPFAVMVRDAAAADELCIITDAQSALLTSQRRPIVLLRKRARASLADQIAPLNPFLGIMLPYTPLHHLLIRDLFPTPLVMTSGNRSDEPIAIDEADAVERLGGIADLFLVHNRPIHVRCDDSVTRVIDHQEAPVRRSRGYAPQPIPTPWSHRAPILAVGGQLKATFALGSDRRAIISHHLGDLDHLQAYRAFERDIAFYEQLFATRPACIAHDLHPDYASTRYAQRRAAQEGIPAIAVQHHHAHMASCMAENGLTGPVIGVTFDGAGYGTDGAIWGGEFLVGDYSAFERAAHLRYIAMPGGEQATHHPWRMAAAYFMDAGTSCATFEQRQPAPSLRTVRQMLERNFNCPNTSSAGRLFDAVAALAGVRDSVTYEGQAAMQLEWLASSLPFSRPGAPGQRSSPAPLPPGEVAGTPAGEGVGGSAIPDVVYPFDLSPSDPTILIDTRPLIRAVAHDVDTSVEPALIARRFHSSLVEIIRVICVRLAKTRQINSVVLSGGVFMNALLTSQTVRQLELEGLNVYRHSKVPANDGGLSLGQLAVAANQQGRG